MQPAATHLSDKLVSLCGPLNVTAHVLDHSSNHACRRHIGNFDQTVMQSLYIVCCSQGIWFPVDLLEALIVQEIVKERRPICRDTLLITYSDQACSFALLPRNGLKNSKCGFSIGSSKATTWIGSWKGKFGGWPAVWLAGPLAGWVLACTAALPAG